MADPGHLPPALPSTNSNSRLPVFWFGEPLDTIAVFLSEPKHSRHR